MKKIYYKKKKKRLKKKKKILKEDKKKKDHNYAELAKLPNIINLVQGRNSDGSEATTKFAFFY